jgi:hypothetical protein
MSTSLSARRLVVALAVLASAAIALVGARPAPGDVVTPVVTLGPTTILNDLAIVSGTVSATSPSSVVLTINGQPVGLNAAGAFAATVNLGGQSALNLAVRNPATGEVSTVNIPLTSNLVGPGGVISPSVLSALEEAAVAVTKPVGGFVSVGGDKPITVGGTVGDKDQLAGLSVNGVDALSAVGSDGGFAVPIPGTSREVTVLMTDKQGVSQSTTLPVGTAAPTAPAPAAASATTVSAAQADGVRITSVRFFAKRVKSIRRIRMVLTVKDRLNRKIRGATISVASTKSGRLVRRAAAKRSNKAGQVGYVLRLRPKAFGARLFLVTTAKTPTAKATKRVSIRLPRLAARRR